MKIPGAALTHLATISYRLEIPTVIDASDVYGVCGMIDASQFLAPFVNDERLRLGLRFLRYFVVKLPSTVTQNQPVHILWYLVVSHPSLSPTRACVGSGDVGACGRTGLILATVHFPRPIAVFANDAYVCDWNGNHWSFESRPMQIDVVVPAEVWWPWVMLSIGHDGSVLTESTAANLLPLGLRNYP